MYRTAIASFALIGIPAAFGQQAISVKSGLIHHVEGRARIEGNPIKLEVGKFQAVQEGETLSTSDGRAEVLLTPGVFLRLGTGSSLRMLSTGLTDTQVEILTGAALVEVVEMEKDNRVVLKVGGSQTALQRYGLYLFDASAGRVRVFEGKVLVSRGNESVSVSRGRQASISPVLSVAKFNMKEREVDQLYAWSQSRADLVARANVSAATAYRSNGYRMTSSMWAWYPGMGLMTFMPRSGCPRSGFGWFYYSPAAVWQYYAPRYEQPSYGGGGGLAQGGYNPGNNGPAWSGMGGGNVSSGPVASSGGMDGGRAAAPAAAPAVSNSGGGRGR